MQFWHLTIYLLLPVAGIAQQYTHSQDRIKSIYTYNFIKEIQWPHFADPQRITICMAAPDNLYQELSEMAKGKNLHGRSINVQKLAGITECNSCDLIYIEEGDARAETLPSSCASLIVTGGFFKKTLSNIALIYKDQRLQFSVNKALCEKQGFRVSMHLMSLSNQDVLK